MLEFPALPEGATFVSMDVDLDGVELRYQFHFNTRTERWYVDLYDLEDNPVLLGVKLVVDAFLWRKHQATVKLPPGQLVAVSLDGDDPPGVDEVGRRVRVIYVTKAEMDSLPGDELPAGITITKV